MPAAKKLGRPPSEDLWAQRTDEILDAAARLFAERGYSGADTQELANRLQVGKGTIYRYFPSKSDLFLAAVDRGMRRLLERIDAVLASPVEPLEQMRVAIHEYLTFFDEHPEFIELLIQERANFRDRKTPTYFEYRDADQQRGRPLIAKLIAEKRVRDMPPERIHDVLGDLLYGTMFTNYFTGRRKPLKDQADEIIDVVFHGILTDSERARQGPRGVENEAK